MIHEYKQNHLVNLILKVVFEGKMHTTSNKFSVNNHCIVLFEVPVSAIKVNALLRNTNLNIVFSQRKIERF